MSYGIPIKWQEWDQLLGTMPDTSLALIVKCHPGSVKNRRLSKGIQAYLRPVWSEVDQELLTSGQQKCLKCEQVKSLDCFTIHSTATDGRKNRHCLECENKRQREARRKRKQEIVDKVGGCCQSCGFDKYLSALQFHHVDGPKLFNPLEGVYWKKYRHLLDEELAKCCLLCSTCHDAYHGGELQLSFTKTNQGWYTIKEIQ